MLALQRRPSGEGAKPGSTELECPGFDGDRDLPRTPPKPGQIKASVKPRPAQGPLLRAKPGRLASIPRRARSDQSIGWDATPCSGRCSSPDEKRGCLLLLQQTGCPSGVAPPEPALVEISAAERLVVRRPRLDAVIGARAPSRPTGRCRTTRGRPRPRRRRGRHRRPSRRRGDRDRAP